MIYSALLAVGSLLAAPKALYQLVRYGKGKKRWMPKNLMWKRDLKRPLVWFHAVSFGEVNAIQSLASKFKDAGWQIVISTITETGQAQAKKIIGFADCHTYLPLDFKWLVEPLVNQYQPELLLISETDLWMHFIEACKKHGAKVALVNGKISEKSLKAWKLFPFLSRPLFQKIDDFFVQSEHYQRRFLQLGVPASKVQVVGNLKYDVHYPDNADCPETQVVFGSTHRGEEDLFLDVIQKLNLKAMIVPRHPERFDEVEELIRLRKINYCRLSKGYDRQAQVILVDQMGLLFSCYKKASLAAVGGSFVPNVGGHNIMEPLFAGTPVLFGPFMHKQPQMTADVLNAGAGIQVAGNLLAEKIASLLQKKETLQALKTYGEKLILGSRGASERVWQSLTNKCLH